MATAPPSVTLLPTPPTTADPTSFDSRADAFLGALPTFQTQTNAVATNVFSNATEALNSAVNAATSAQSSANSAAAASGAANFKGLWSTLSGPLNKPATVKHNNRIWLLLNNLANVAASEPGVSADWTTGDSGVIVQVVTANTIATPGPTFVVVTAGVTITAPSVRNTGDEFNLRNSTPGIIYVNWNGATVKNQIPDNPMAIPPFGWFDAIYTGSTYS